MGLERDGPRGELLEPTWTFRGCDEGQYCALALRSAAACAYLTSPFFSLSISTWIPSAQLVRTAASAPGTLSPDQGAVPSFNAPVLVKSMVAGVESAKVSWSVGRDSFEWTGSFGSSWLMDGLGRGEQWAVGALGVVGGLSSKLCRQLSNA